MKYIYTVIILLMSLVSHATVVEPLLLEMPTASSVEEAVLELRKEGDKHYEEDKYDKALVYYKRAKEIIQYYEVEEKHGIVYYDLAYTYFEQNDYAECLRNFNEYLLYTLEIEPKKKARVFKKMAKGASILGDAEQSFEYQLLNLGILEDLNDTVEIGAANYELGSIMFFQDNFDEAKDYYEKALAINYVIRDSFTIFACLSAIGAVANREGDVETAMRYNERALGIAKAKKYQTGLAYAYHNLSADLLALGKLEESLEYNFKSLRIKEKQNDPFGISNNCRVIGKTYTRMGKLEEAERYLTRSLDIALDINSHTRLAEAYEGWSVLEEKKKNYRKSHAFLKKYMSEMDSIESKASFHKMKAALYSYEVHKRDKEIDMLVKDKEIDRLRMIAVAFILILVLLLVVVLAIAYRKMRAVNHLLGEKQILIEEQNLALERSNKDLEQFAYVASHDMRAPIRTISSFNKLIQRKYGDKLDKNGREFLDFIGEAAQRLDIMLTDLLDYSRVNTRNYNKESLVMGYAVMLAMHNLHSVIDETNTEIHIGNLPSIMGNRIQIVRLFQNLIGNGIKYNNKEDKKITIDCEERDNQYVFSVKDNGIGIPDEFQKEIFEIFRRLHAASEYEGSGIGLATCKKIVGRHDGDIWVESSPGSGTTIYFSVPFSERLPIEDEMTVKPIGGKIILNSNVHSPAC